MNKKIILKSTLGLIAVTAILLSCTKEVSSRPNFVFGQSSDKTAVAKINGEVIKKSELYKGLESEIYEAEMKVFELKMNKLRALVLEKIMLSDPKKKGLTNDQYLDKFVTSNISAGQKEIDAFVLERKIPKEHVNEQMKTRVKAYLEIEMKKKAIETWLTTKTAKNPVNIYLDKPSRPVFDVVVGNAPVFGNKNAKVTVVEYSDFQCPYCAKGATIISQLKKKYGNKIQVAFKNFPLPFHNHAKLASVAAMCANEQGSNHFWKMHDKMFADQTKLAKADLVISAKALGLKMDTFSKCLDSSKFNAIIEKDIEAGKKIGVKSTPTFFVNGMMINGAVPVEQFSELIDAELKK